MRGSLANGTLTRLFANVFNAEIGKWHTRDRQIAGVALSQTFRCAKSAALADGHCARNAELTRSVFHRRHTTSFQFAEFDSFTPRFRLRFGKSVPELHC